MGSSEPIVYVEGPLSMKLAGKTLTSSTSDTDSSGSQEVRLRKNVGLMSGVALIVGTMIGSGIFVSPKGVLEGSGSVAMSILIWAACGLLSMLGALTYAELGTAIPLSGAEHSYIMFTFAQGGVAPDKVKGGQARGGRGFWGPIPAFLYDWVAATVIRPAMFAIMTLSLGTYACQPFYGVHCPAPASVVRLVTIVAMTLICLINCASVKAATRVQNVLTACKLLAIAVIAIGGLVMIATGSTDIVGEGFEGTTGQPAVLAMAFYNGLWAYDGWNNLNFVTEELKNPSKNLPRSILLGIPLVTLCYVLVNLGYFSIISRQELLLSTAVAATWAGKLLGVMAWTMPVFVVLSCFGSANGSLFASARLCYVAGRDGHLPAILSFIDIRRLSPSPSLVFTTVIAILMILQGDLGSLIGFFGFASWIFYGLTAACLLILRYTRPDLPRPYKVPILVPVLVVLASVFLVVVPIAQDPRVEFLYVLLFILGGLLLYVPFVHFRLQPACSGKVTKFLQRVFLVAAPDS